MLSLNCFIKFGFSIPNIPKDKSFLLNMKPQMHTEHLSVFIRVHLRLSVVLELFNLLEARERK
jgi:hypothetical protein